MATSHQTWMAWSGGFGTDAAETVCLALNVKLFSTQIAEA
jgi:hypothetical protein